MSLSISAQPTHCSRITNPPGPHPHVIDVMSPGTGPEGFAISPNGKIAAAPFLLGTGANDGDWFKTKAGELVVLSIGADGKLTVTARAPLGGLPEGIAYSANSKYLYVGNYFDKDLQVFHLANGTLTEAGPRLKLAGQPASVRGPAR